MAYLSQQQAAEILTKPKNKVQIQKSRNYQERLIFHTEPILESASLPSRAKADFLGWVRGLLPSDKYARFEQLCTMPLDTVESCKAIFDELDKFYEAADKYIKDNFATSTLEQDFTEYLNSIEDADWWANEGRQALRNGINSFLVVDLPTQQTTPRPQPYYYLVNIDNVTDVEISKDGVEYIAFVVEGRAIVIDSNTYRVFVKPSGRDWKLESESIHGLGYCPVCSFYDNPIRGTRQISKRGSLTDILGKLDWLLYYRVCKRYLELYNWPILVTYEKECTYRDQKTGSQCENGKYEGTGGLLMDCPICASGSDFVGPGSYLEVKQPAQKDQFDPLSNGGLKIISIPTETIEYVTKEIERLENEVYIDSVGWDGDALNKQAVNDNQVSANFESKEAVLNGIKEIYQRAMKFCRETMARLMYGEYFYGSTVDLGSEYFLKSVDTLTIEYDTASKAGLPEYYLQDLRTQIVNTKFRHNPEQQMRDAILSQLLPYPDLLTSQLTTMGVKDMDLQGFVIKINFTTFIQRFERENGSIVEFGSAISESVKIDRIQQVLRSYADEIINAMPDPANDGTIINQNK